MSLGRCEHFGSYLKAIEKGWQDFQKGDKEKGQEGGLADAESKRHGCGRASPTFHARPMARSNHVVILDGSRC